MLPYFFCQTQFRKYSFIISLIIFKISSLFCLLYLHISVIITNRDSAQYIVQVMNFKLRPIKKILSQNQHKDTQDDSIQRLEQCMKSMITCFTEISTRLQSQRNNRKDSQDRGSSRQRPHKWKKNDGNQRYLHQNKLRNDERKEQRFRNIEYFNEIKSEGKQDRTYEILDWVGGLCNQVLSIGFHMLKNGELDSIKIKSYCSENIMRNILYFARQNNLTKQEFKAINESLKKQIFPYFCLKYPESEEAEVNISLKSMLKESNNIGQNINDLVYKSGVKFERQQNGNYNTQIMQFLNYVIKLPNKKIKQQDMNPINIGESESLSQKFEKEMQGIFRMVENQNNVINMKKFDPKNPEKWTQNNENQVKEQSQRQKQAYLEKVRSYTSFQIGRKLSQNFKQFSEAEIKSGILKLKNSAIMRIVTKWCQQLESYFEEDQIRTRSNQFRMRDGNQKFLKQQFFISMLSMLLKREKVKIQKQVDLIQQNNYQQQGYCSRKQVHPKLKRYSQEQAIFGQFSTVIFKNTQNYLINYLNLLIHGICTALHDFQKFVKVAIHKNWVLSHFDFRDSTNQMRPEDAEDIMKKVHEQGQVKENVHKEVPELVTFKVGDLLRCKCSSRQNQIIALYKQLERISYFNPSLLKIIRVKNRLDGGNRDILMNLMFKQELLVEVQLAINFQKSKFITHSNKFNHFIYELRRAEFGPISEMCSIWINQDPRSSHYLSFFQQQNIRRSLEQSNKQTVIKNCCRQSKNYEILTLPFTCNLCKCFYYHFSFAEKHIYCKICSQYTCFLCRIELSNKNEIKQILPELAIGNNFNFSTIQFLKAIPESGGAILNLKAKSRQPKLFKTISYKNELLLFENTNIMHPDEPLRIKLISKFKLNKQIPNQFFKQNLIYRFDKIQQKIPEISMLALQQQYILSMYLKQAQRTQKKSVAIIGKDVNQQIFTVNSELKWTVAQKINFSQNKFKDSKYFFERFPNVKLAVLEGNHIKSISKQCQHWRHIERLYISMNDITQIHGNVNNWKKLIQLSIKNNKLQTLPPQIGQLQQLRILNLDANHLKTLPTEISKLTNLQYLNTCNNWMQDLPQSFGQLPSLKTFVTFHNGIKKLPISFGNLKSLQQFNACYCSNLTQLPDNFGDLSKLRKLDISSSKITTLPQSFGKLSSLQNFLAYDNKIAGKLPANFGQLKSLQVCNLYRNKIESPLPEFTQLVNVKLLDLSYNKISTIPDSIQKLQKLQVLRIQQNDLTELNQKICELSALIALWVSSNKIKKIPQSIKKLSNLAALSFDDNLLTVEGIPESIKNLQKLMILSLQKNEMTQFPEMIKQMNWLQQINMSDMEISEIPAQLLHFDKLAKLQISKQHLSDLSLERFSQIEKITAPRYSQFLAKIQKLINI